MRGGPRWVMVVALVVLALMLRHPLFTFLELLLVEWRILVALGVAGLAFWAVRKALAARGPVARWVEVELTGIARGGPRDPVSFTELLAALKRTAVGKVRSRGRRITIEAGDGKAELEALEPARVSVANLKVRASTRLSAVLTADALAVALGPLRVLAEGVELEVDGTTPRAQLEREVWTRQMERMQRLERELEDRQRH